MKIKTLQPVFGNNRCNASRVGLELGKLRWCGIPFVGGAPEIPHIQTASGLAGDLHRHIINMDRVVADERLLAELTKELNDRQFHPDVLMSVQARCMEREHGAPLFHGIPIQVDADVQWAADYFCCCWMGRGGHAGKKTEFTQGLSVRFTSSGGDSVVRFRNAIASLPAWHEALKRWQFTLSDAFDFMERVKDQANHGVYLDPPWPDAGREYLVQFDDNQQRRLADRVTALEKTRVVIRFGDHPLIRELYPRSKWNWIEYGSTNQAGGAVNEVLILNGQSNAA